MNRKLFIFLILLAAFLFWIFLQNSAEKHAKVEEKASAPTFPNLQIPKSEAENSYAGDRVRPTLSKKWKALSVDEIRRVRAEMKISLAGMYAAERAFFSENGRYTTDIFKGAGFRPDVPSSGITFKFGFLSPYSPKELVSEEDPRLMDSDMMREIEKGKSFPSFEYQDSAKYFSLKELTRFCEMGCTADNQHFEILAAAQFSDGRPPEVWSINDRKELTQVQNGTEEGK